MRTKGKGKAKAKPQEEEEDNHQNTGNKGKLTTSKKLIQFQLPKCTKISEFSGHQFQFFGHNQLISPIHNNMD